MATAIVPGIYDPHLADLKLGAPTEASYAWLRRLAVTEGLLVGPSGGAAVWAAVKVASQLTSGCVVTVLPDSGARYVSEDHLWEER
jgi:cysteine synthase B